VIVSSPPLPAEVTVASETVGFEAVDGVLCATVVGTTIGMTGTTTGMITGGGAMTGTITGATMVIGSTNACAYASAGEPKPDAYPAAVPAARTSRTANTPDRIGWSFIFFLLVCVVVIGVFVAR
jgi:hypothetical protein